MESGEKFPCLLKGREGCGMFYANATKLSPKTAGGVGGGCKRPVVLCELQAAGPGQGHINPQLQPLGGGKQGSAVCLR